MNTPGDKKMLHVTQVDVTMFAQSLRTQGTPWAAGCADILESLWQECEDSRYADIEHEQLGCHVAKTGIYAVSAIVPPREPTMEMRSAAQQAFIRADKDQLGAIWKAMYDEAMRRSDGGTNG